MFVVEITTTNIILIIIHIRIKDNINEIPDPYDKYIRCDSTQDSLPDTSICVLIACECVSVSYLWIGVTRLDTY